MDLLHPLTSLEWSEYRDMPVSVCDTHAVVLGKKIYIGGGKLYPGPHFGLLIYDLTEDSWNVLDTPTKLYAITTYQSQLVLVGGKDPYSLKATNMLWVLDEQCQAEEHYRAQSLPPMKTECYNSSAISVGYHLFVAGGRGGTQSRSRPLASVEVYDGCKWRHVQSLPRAFSWIKSTLHEGNWYLVGGTRQGREVYHTSPESLLATTYSDEAEKTSVWKKLPDAPLKKSILTVLLNYLIAIGTEYWNSAIHAYSPSIDSWVHVGDLPVNCYSTCTVVLSTGELLVVESGLTSDSSHLFKAKIGGDLDSCYFLHPKMQLKKDLRKII